MLPLLYVTQKRIQALPAESWAKSGNGEKKKKRGEEKNSQSAPDQPPQHVMQHARVLAALPSAYSESKLATLLGRTSINYILWRRGGQSRAIRETRKK